MAKSAGLADFSFNLLTVVMASLRTSPSLLRKMGLIVPPSAATAAELSRLAIGRHNPVMRSRPEGFSHAAKRFSASARASSACPLSAATAASTPALPRR